MNPSPEQVKEKAMKTKNLAFRKGALCKYSKPIKGEHDLRFICLTDPRDGDPMGDFQLVCDWFLKPIETVEYSEMEVCAS